MKAKEIEEILNNGGKLILENNAYFKDMYYIGEEKGENRITVTEYCISNQTDTDRITKPFHWNLPQSFRLLQFAIAEYFLLSIPKHPE